MSVELQGKPVDVTFPSNLTKAEIVEKILNQIILVRSPDSFDLDNEIKTELAQLVNEAQPGTVIDLPAELLAKVNRHNYELALVVELKRFYSHLEAQIDVTNAEIERLGNLIAETKRDAIYFSKVDKQRQQDIAVRIKSERKLTRMYEVVATYLETAEELALFLKQNGRTINSPAKVNCFSFEIESPKVAPVVEFEETIYNDDVVATPRNIPLTLKSLAVASLVFAVLAYKMTNGDPEELTVYSEEGSEEIPNSIAEFQKLQEIYDRDPNMQFVFNIIAYQLSVAMPLNTGREHAFTFSLRKPQSLTIPLPYTNIIDWSEFTYSITTYPDSNIHKLSIWADGQRENAITLDVQLSTRL